MAVRLPIVRLLGAPAAVDQVRGVRVMCEALVPHRSGPSPSPPERPAPDPDREG